MHRRWAGAFLTALLGLIASSGSPAQTPPTPQTSSPNDKLIPVAMFLDVGVNGKGPGMLEEHFHQHTPFRIVRLKAADIRAGKLAGFPVLIVPGGSGKLEAKTLQSSGREAIKHFVEQGGVYVGICAGCYLATCHYDWSLHLLPVKVRDADNWERGRAMLTLSLTPQGRQSLGVAADTVKTIYHNGPVLDPLPDAENRLIPLATYKDEITRKGAQEGLMVDTPAIAAAPYGRGWVIGVSPHPEQTAELKSVIPAAIRWALSKVTPEKAPRE